MLSDEHGLRTLKYSSREKTQSHLLFGLPISIMLNPTRQRHVLPSVDVVKSNPHGGHYPVHELSLARVLMII